MEKAEKILFKLKKVLDNKSKFIRQITEQNTAKLPNKFDFNVIFIWGHWLV
jgi:hypothetical protein